MWSFRKAPGFFDVVTYTGDGTSGRAISHGLGSTPGMVIIKCTNASTDWPVWHRSLPNVASNYFVRLNTTDGEGNPYQAFYGTPNASNFYVGANAAANGTGNSYVAYVFAHDDQSFGTDEDEAIIKCGSYTGNGTTGQEINLGFEPQWVLIKRTDSTAAWNMFDSMRGWIGGGAGSNQDSKRIYANTSDAESNANGQYITPNGFYLNQNYGGINNSSGTYVYMAIRRPHKPPESATEVFALDATSASGTTANAFDATFPVDMIFMQRWGSGEQKYVGARLMAEKNLYANATNSTINSSFALYDRMDGVWRAFNDTNYSAQMFKRAPGFYDTVTYTGDGSATRQISHDLDATPELIIVKSQNNTSQWLVWNTTFGQGTTGNYILLNSTSGRGGSTPPIFTTSAPTSAYFNVSFDSGLNVQFTTNASSYAYIAHLFATLDGISKVGTYSGTGSNINVDCGFTAGARFVLIKRTDTTGDWYMWDTAHGIVSGNDPYIRLNDANAQVTGNDYIDPLNAGFTVTSSAPAALNASGGTYLFLAIA